MLTYYDLYLLRQYPLIFTQINDFDARGERLRKLQYICEGLLTDVCNEESFINFVGDNYVDSTDRHGNIRKYSPFNYGFKKGKRGKRETGKQLAEHRDEE